MFDVRHVDAVAPISDVRSNTNAFIQHVVETRIRVLIVKNNEPVAVVLPAEGLTLPEGLLAPDEG